MGKWRWLYFGFVAFVIVIFIYTFPGLRSGHRQKKALEETYHRYSDAVMAHDYTTAYSFGDSQFKAAMTLAEFAGQQKLIESKLGTQKSARIEGLYAHGVGSPMRWTATVNETRGYENGEIHLLYVFHLEDNRWQLFGYKQID